MARPAPRYAASLARQYNTTGLRPSLSTAAIPAEYLGVTFVYDVATDGYVASDLTGAPSGGVRFLLYAVNPVTGLPIEPLVEIGYADITASETASSSTVRIIVVSGGVTYLDYAVAASGGTSSPRFRYRLRQRRRPGQLQPRERLTFSGPAPASPSTCWWCRPAFQFAMRRPPPASSPRPPRPSSTCWPGAITGPSRSRARRRTAPGATTWK
jgi:hypothetical protein